MVPNPIITSVTWPSSPHGEGIQCKTDITYRNDGTDGEVFSRVVDSTGAILDSFISSVAAGEISTDSLYFYMPNHDITIYAQVGVGLTVTDQKGPKTILVTAPPVTPQVTTVTVNAPPTVNKNVLFEIHGVVKDQYGAVMGGVPVNLYDNGAYFATITTSSFGTYSKNHSISLVGIHELAANAAAKWAYTSINITEPPVEPPPCPDPFPWATDPEGPYEGETVNFIEAYRGWGIWWLTGPGVYGITDPNCIDQTLFYGTPQACRNKINDLIGAGIPTTLTINAPGAVGPGEPFNIIGQLTRNDTGVAIPNMSISVSYNGKPLGSVLTDMQGVYTIPASIPTTGTYTLKAEFLGTAEYAASKSTADTMVTTPLEAVIKIIGSVATGLALIRYSLS